MTKDAAVSHSPAQRIFIVRGVRVMLDDDLAALYGVETRNLNKAVARNKSRFPVDFAFPVAERELAVLKFQSGTSRSERRTHGGRRKSTTAFTEQGVAMLSSVLRSPRAIAVNIEIMRAFVRLRDIVAADSELRAKLDAMEAEYDERFAVVFTALRQLMDAEAARRPKALKPKPPIGFR